MCKGEAHPVDLQELIDWVSHRLHDKKMRLTQPRLRLLETFAGSGRLLSAQELYRDARSQGINIGLTTVYRLLEALSELGLARAFLLSGEIRYTFCSPRHHYHLICHGCGKIKEIFDCPVLETVTDGEGFQCDGHQLDFFGLCRQCQEKTESPEP
ncbi:Ferric uptake regulator family [Acididesulfobacillus acetoxydans]|uniref:Ferric uptake regulator family n=1 Tax=Acididesulfobacillus acetoxydans TaxID=1561005 RepID=A0A8S0X303_9FIRM|nr:Fur family transcriptional regulator [Acididesulfobacillus acetoxydans]CAA7599660.1 Ferric uptake regulator family [Acididesulfobacillus acetoxydans]CEJ06212.1 Ferric uptake regulator family [Acididesulfobacillus acetoxydans]